MALKAGSNLVYYESTASFEHGCGHGYRREAITYPMLEERTAQLPISLTREAI